MSEIRGHAQRARRGTPLLLPSANVLHDDKAKSRARQSVGLCSLCANMRSYELTRRRRHLNFARIPPLLLLVSFLLSFCSFSVIATPASLPFSECTAGNAIDPSLKINASTVYGQIVTNDELGRHLNLTVIGNTGQAIEPISNATDLLSESSRRSYSC